MSSSNISTFLEDLISIYHEILLNEIAIMRANTIIEDGVNTGDVIIYYSSSYPLYTGHSNPSRGLDYLVLIYSILNGLRRLIGECGYNVLRPLDPEPICPIYKIKEKLTRILEYIKKNREPSLDKESLEELMAELILEMIDHGLLYMLPRQSLDNFNIINIKDHMNVEDQNIKIIKLEKPEDLYLNLYSIRIYNKLHEFFNRYGIDLDKTLKSFISKLNERTKISEEYVKLENIFFKTLHGMLYKYTSTASSLPFHPATLEANVLPFMIEPPLPKSFLDTSIAKSIKDPQLRHVIKNCVTAIARKENISLQQQSIDEIFRIVDNVLNKISEKYPLLSSYQYEYLLNMFKTCSENKNILSVITSPTGTGKTLIFLIYVLVKILIYKLLGKKIKVIIIYPRKALARDQLIKIIDVVDMINSLIKDMKNLPDMYRNSLYITVGIRDGDSLGVRGTLKIAELRGLKLRDKKICHKIDHDVYKVFLSEYCDNRSINLSGEEIRWLKDVKSEKYLRECDLIITNHSIINKLVNEILGKTRSDDLSIYKEIIGNIRIMVIDEAHVYIKEDLEILATALLKLLYLRYFLSKDRSPEKISELIENLDMILSSATLTDQQIINRDNGKIYTGNIIGFFKVKSYCEDQNVEMPVALKEFLQNILSKEIFEEYRMINKVIYIDFECMVSKDLKIERRKDIIWKGPYRVKTALVISPYPHRESWTALAESIVAALHWLNSIRSRLEDLDESFSRSLGLVFIDSKGTLKDIYRTFIRRQILDAQDHADRVLLTGKEKYKYSKLDNRERIEAKKFIIEYIDNIIKKKNYNGFQLIYEENIFKDFTVLPLYFKLSDLSLLIDTHISNYNGLLNVIDNKLSNSFAISEMLDDINEFALGLSNVYGKGGYEEFLKTLKNLKKIILMHHGDLNRESRAIIESHMKGESDPVPLIVFSTSTMELGVDIEHVPLIIQFATEPTSVELNQRLGRSGRSLASFYISTLILILRNTGEDLIYSRDQEAVEYVYNFTMPKTYNPYEHADIMLRHLTKILVDAIDENSAISSLEKQIILKEFVNTPLVNHLIRDLKDVYSIYVKKIYTREFISHLSSFCTQIDYKNSLNKLKELVSDINKELMNISGTMSLSINSLRDVETSLLNINKEQKSISILNILNKINYTYITLDEVRSNINLYIKNPLYEIEHESNEFKRISIRNLLPHLRILSKSIDKIDRIENLLLIISSDINKIRDAYHETVLPYRISEIIRNLEDVRGRLLKSMYGLMIYICHPYSLNLKYNLNNMLIMKDDVKDYIKRYLYIYDVIHPGITRYIGTSFINHLLIEYEKGLNGIIYIMEDPNEVLKRARPLHIELSR